MIKISLKVLSKMWHEFDEGNPLAVIPVIIGAAYVAVMAFIYTIAEGRL